MKLCYCDETGTGEEPIAVMAGVIVDAQRMHVTKDHWQGLLDSLSSIAGCKITELHTRDFYAGNNVWRSLKGAERSRVITIVFEWLAERKHDIVYSAVLKERYFANFKAGRIPAELNTLWRFMGLHLLLAIQKVHQTESRNKGHTIFVFDNEEREKMRFTDLVANPPAWSDSYYNKGKKQKRFDQIVDIPYFGDSREVALIQVADFVAYFLRRYAEITDNLVPAKYPDETPKIAGWIDCLKKRCIGKSFIYPSRDLCDCTKLFLDNAPDSMKAL